MNALGQRLEIRIKAANNDARVFPQCTMKFYEMLSV